MATLDRIEPAYKPWTPSAAGLATDDSAYVGRHRRQGVRRLSLRAMFYMGKHKRLALQSRRGFSRMRTKS
jgi:hypothetical protein